MAKFASGKIERIATHAVRQESLKPNAFLITNIPEGDKDISFDGDIKVFANNLETKESLIGSVPVQVKGNQVSQFKIGKRSFGLELEHFRNYYDREGVLLLVVEMKDTGETKIFYKQLLTKELSLIINKLIESKGKSRHVELRPLEETSLYVVCRKFLDERKLQPRVLVENNPYPPMSFSKYSMSSLTYNPGHEATNNIFDHDFMMYGVDSTFAP
jgi:hypothetical protein